MDVDETMVQPASLCRHAPTSDHDLDDFRMNWPRATICDPLCSLSSLVAPGGD